MTAAQLQHLADLAAEASDYLADDDPAAARVLADAANLAARAAETTGRAENTARLRASIQALNTAAG